MTSRGYTYWEKGREDRQFKAIMGHPVMACALQLHNGSSE